MQENCAFLSEQIITYIGNKRALLSFIGEAVELARSELSKDKIDVCDIFSGSGAVARSLKQHARVLLVNDLEEYARVINTCYLANGRDIDKKALEACFKYIQAELKRGLHRGFISELYAPCSDSDITPGERVFYTVRNAMYIDTARQLLENVPEPYRTYLLAPLLYESSVHCNTSGVFKGFYKNSKTGVGQFGGDGKNALQRILGDIELRLPVFSNFSCDVKVFKRDANELARELPPLDLVYIDPPYNQHPYGSNYFMLNLISEYRRPENISRVSGIPKNWNKSLYNKKQTARGCLFDLCKSVRAKYLLISFSSDGFISQSEMTEMLESIGEVRAFSREYNTFRGSRNLSSRDIHVKEFLYLVKKNVE